jgi:hypothetical protein
MAGNEGHLALGPLEARFPAFFDENPVIWAGKVLEQRAKRLVDLVSIGFHQLLQAVPEPRPNLL